MKHVVQTLLCILSLALLTFGLLAPIQASATVYQSGKASWYGSYHHGRKTASGERFNMYSLTAAHKHLPLGTIVEVKNKTNGKTVQVKINDRGPYHGNRVIDLSKGAATQLGMLKAGVGQVEITVLSKPESKKKSNQLDKQVLLAKAKERAEADTKLSTLNVTPKEVTPILPSLNEVTVEKPDDKLNDLILALELLEQKEQERLDKSRIIKVSTTPQIKSTMTVSIYQDYF